MYIIHAIQSYLFVMIALLCFQVLLRRFLVCLFLIIVIIPPLGYVAHLSFSSTPLWLVYFSNCIERCCHKFGNISAADCLCHDESLFFLVFVMYDFFYYSISQFLFIFTWLVCFEHFEQICVICFVYLGCSSSSLGISHSLQK